MSDLGLPFVAAPASSAPAQVRAARVVSGWGLLALTDVAVKVFGFRRFYRMMASWPTLGAVPGGARPALARESCAAVDRARTYYFKRAWCLQRAAAAVCFLRLRGVRAEMVIGVRKFPFYAHAWVEVDGVVVSDSAEVRTEYREITRC